MSTVKSSSEHLTLNADGTGKEIKLQNNGTTNVTVASDGNLGVGTSSPYAKLHIQGSNYSVTSGGDADTGLRFSGGTTGIDTYTNGLSFSYGSGSSAISGVQSGSDTDRIGISFFTHPSSTGTASAVEQMRIHHDGYLINPNGITLGTADASTFASANTLDDYEEGTWTPTLINVIFTDNGSSGTYVKVGKMVICSGTLNVTGVDTTDGSPIGFGGLPFNGAGSENGVCNISYRGSTLFATLNTDVTENFTNGNRVELRGANGGFTNTYSSASNTSGIVYFTATYETA